MTEHGVVNPCPICGGEETHGHHGMRPGDCGDAIVNQLVKDILHGAMGWRESLKRLEDLARGNG